MAKQNRQTDLQNLPPCAADFIKQVIKRMRYRKKVRREVQAELTAHFEDELKECKTQAEKEQKAEQLIAGFGDAKLLAVLLRRAKKRCRPLWRTVIARTCQAVVLLFICLILHGVWFSMGEPTISVDYLALLNQMNRPLVSGEDNAWPHYEKAIELFVEPGADLRQMDAFRDYREPASRSFDNLTEQDKQEISKWVELNEAAWQEFVAGSSKSYCYRRYEYGAGDEDRWLLNIVLPRLNTLRYLARLGLWRSLIAMQSGRPNQDLQNCLMLARTAAHWHGKGAIVEQLTGLSLSTLAHEEMLRIAETQSLSANNLKQLQQKILQMYPQGYQLMNIKGERLMFLDTVQQVFTGAGQGGGHLVPDRLIDFLDTTDALTLDSEDKSYLLLWTAASMVHARRDETVAKGNQLYDQQSRIAKMSPYKRHLNNIGSAEDILLSLPRHRYFLLRHLMPALDRASAYAHQCKTLHQATVTVLALKRWRLEKGEYPLNLDDLLDAGFLKQLPMDPYSDKPLVYRRTGDGFVLYSVGGNFEDDGGKPGRNDRGQVRDWIDNGDTVFWPLP